MPVCIVRKDWLLFVVVVVVVFVCFFLPFFFCCCCCFSAYLNANSLLPENFPLQGFNHLNKNLFEVHFQSLCIIAITFPENSLN